MEQGIRKASIITKGPKNNSKCERSNSLYEQVIQKNFQTINELLKKLNTIFTRHQDLETEMVNYSKRLIKIESDMESIHNEHRRDNLFIFSNIEDLKHELNGIDSHIKKIYDDYRKKGLMGRIGEATEHRASLNSSCYPSQIQDETQSRDMFDSNFMKKFTENQNLKKQAIRKISSQNQNFLDMESQFRRKPQTGSTSQIGENRRELQNDEGNERGNKKRLSKQSMDNLRLNKREFANNLSGLDESIGEDSYRDRVENQLFGNKNQKNPGKHGQKGSLIDGTQSQYWNSDAEADRKGAERASGVAATILNMRSGAGSNQFMSGKQYGDSLMVLLKNEDNREVVLRHINNYKIVQEYIVKQANENEAKSTIVQARLKEAEQKIDQLTVEATGAGKQINLLSSKLSGVIEECSNLVTKHNLTENVYNLLKQINKLREYCHNHFADKVETRKAILFLQSKINSAICQDQTRDKPEDVGVIVSKCLGCNRPAINLSETTPKSVVRGDVASPHNVENQPGLKELKKKTLQLVRVDKLEKHRAFSKFQRCR